MFIQEVDADSESVSVNWPIIIYTLSILGLIAMLGGKEPYSEVQKNHKWLS